MTDKDDCVTQWIDRYNDAHDLLPICHTTKWEFFKDILKDGHLSSEYSQFPPKPAEIYKNVTYLNYGMPFYIYETGDGSAIYKDTVFDNPIGLIFKPRIAVDVDYFYPFDTGALIHGMYKELLDCRTLEDIECYKCEISDGIELKKTISRYFGNNFNYCHSKFTLSEDQTKSDKEKKLFNLLNYMGESKIDMRLRAIEIHALKNIDLSNLIAIVLPEIESRPYQLQIDRIIKNNKIEILEYDDLERSSNEGSRRVIMQKALDFYKSEKILKRS